MRLSRREVGFAVLVGLAGCLNRERDAEQSRGGPALASVSQRGDLRLTSPAFDDGGGIPATYGRQAANVNPPFGIESVPDSAASLVLVMDDPDAVPVAGKVWVHWLVWNIPPGTTTIPEGWEPTDATVGVNDFGMIGYGGPDPPEDPHTYRFKLFALDTTLDLERGESVSALGSAMTGHIVAQTALTGTYSP